MISIWTFWFIDQYSAFKLRYGTRLRAQDFFRNDQMELMRSALKYGRVPAKQSTSSVWSQNTKNTKINPLAEILTEKELTELLGVKREFVDNLRRNDKSPFCKDTKTTRFYLTKDVVEYIKSKRVVIDKDV